jgi:regulatory protein
VDAVVALTAARGPGQLVSVGLESGERLLLSSRRVAELRLAAGDQLDGPGLARLRAAAEEERLEQRVLRLLAARPRSRAELRHRLAEWGIAEEAAQSLLGRLTSAGLLDDGRVAAEVSDALRRRGHGSLRTAHELDRLGIDGCTAAPVVDEHAGADPRHAQDLVTRRFGPAPYDRATARRAAAFLARRGFGEDTVADVLGSSVDLI